MAFGTAATTLTASEFSSNISIPFSKDGLRNDAPLNDFLVGLLSCSAGPWTYNGTSLNANCLISGTTLSLTGNGAVGNLTTAGVVVATGNVSGGNLTTAGVVAATGNVSGANGSFGAALNLATGRLTAGATITSNRGITLDAGGLAFATGSSGQLFVAGGIFLINTTQVRWSSTTAYAAGVDDVAIGRLAAGVVKVYGSGGAGDGWMQSSAGRRILIANTTNNTATMTDLTALSMTVVNGRKYSFALSLFLSNSQAAEGAKVDFDGGNATMTDFRAHGTIFDTALLLSTQTTTLGGDFASATMTGASLVEIHGAFTPSANGTFIPRFAENTAAIGNLTAFVGSHLWAEDTP